MMGRKLRRAQRELRPEPAAGGAVRGELGGARGAAEGKMLAKALSDPKLYASGNTALIAKATTRQKTVARELAGLEAAWLELSEKLESLAA
jgi:hypothetical protein